MYIGILHSYGWSTSPSLINKGIKGLLEIYQQCCKHRNDRIVGLKVTSYNVSRSIIFIIFMSRYDFTKKSNVNVWKKYVWKCFQFKKTRKIWIFLFWFTSVLLQHPKCVVSACHTTPLLCHIMYTQQRSHESNVK